MTSRNDGKPIVKKILRSPSLKRKSKTIPITQRVTLEKVLGLTLTKNAGLACDPNTGTIAYPAGCVIVLFNPRKNKQTHIFNSSKKTLTTVAFSRDGKHLASGESGHQPAVRVWDVEEKTQVAQFLGHKFGINCVVFSPNLKYIVSVGSQHDMMVNVWNWKTNSKVKSNKVSSKVNAVAFAEDGSHFVTVGNRHVKFWYLENQKSKVNETVPLLGRSGILGDQKDNFFCDVACGRGQTASSTFVITQSGLLCEFNSKRLLDKWVELRTSSANCISVDEDNIFIGCAGGVVRVFNSSSLHFVTTLPKPHALGVDIAAATSPSHMVINNDNAKYPDTIALVADTTNKKITCVYNDHSLYIWDVRELKKVGKAWSFLFHSSCIWGIETYPRITDGPSIVPPGSFITCSSDDTIRIWNLDPHMAENNTYKHNIYSQEVLKILYIDPTLSNLCDVNYNPAGTKDKTDTNYDGKNGVRAVKVSPDGQHLASGDRLGNVRVHDLQFMEEIQIIEAHDGEVLSLEYSDFPSGPRLLSSTSRDRLVHVFDVEQSYGLIQTLDDHSSAISAVRFTETDHTMKMLSCGADKSLLFRNAVLSPSFQFSLSQHLVGKTTLYDMDIDPTHKFVATACQDRNIRIYNIKTAKQKKCYKGSIGDDGVVTRVHLDPSGSYAATSSTDKNLAILDFYTGEFLASMFGHSEIATGVKFTNDLKHLISTGAEGCIFVWRLSSDFTKQMKNRLEELGRMPKELTTSTEGDLKRGSFVMPKPIVFDQTDDNEMFPVFKETEFRPAEKVLSNLGSIDEVPSRDVKSGPTGSTCPSPGNNYRFSTGPLPSWAKHMSANPSAVTGDLGGQPRGRWAQRVDSQALSGEKPVVLATEPTNDRRCTYDASEVLRRETMVISRPETPPQNLPIITADDENNLEDDADFLPLTFGPRNLDCSGDFDRSLNSTRGSDPSSLNHKWTSRRSLLVDGDDADDEETDSETREVIYYPPNDGDTSDANSNSYKVFAISSDELRAGKNRLRRSGVGTDGSIKDGDSESTDPLSLEDVEEEPEEVPSLPTTPLEPEKDFTPTKSRFVQDNIENFTPIGKDKFTSSLDTLEQQLAEEDPHRIFSPRLSISAKFLHRTGGLARNVARQDTWFDSVQKRKDDMARAVDETRRKLESQFNEEPTRDKKPTMSERKITPPSYPSRSKSMGKADTNSLQVSTFELLPKSLTEEPPKPSKPTHTIKTSSQTTQEKRDSTSSIPKRGSSEKNIPAEVAAESADKPRLYTRRSAADQHSYLKPTQSSRAKIARATSTSNLHRGRSSSSTEDLSKSAHSYSSLENLQDLDDEDLPVASFDNFRHSLSRQKTVSVPNLATCFEEEDEEEEPSNLYSLVDLSKSVPDFMDVDETSSSYSDNSSMAASEPAAVLSLSRSGYHSSRAMRDSSRKVNQWNTRRSMPGDFGGKPSWARPVKTREDFDKFVMPPPSKTQVARTSFLRKAAHAKRRSAPDLTLEQAKNILLGKSGILDRPSSIDNKSFKSKPKTRGMLSPESEYPESGTVSSLKEQFSKSSKRNSNLHIPTRTVYNVSDRKTSSGDSSSVLSKRSGGINSDLDASPLEPPVRDQPSSKSGWSSPPTKDSPTSTPSPLVNGDTSIRSAGASRLPAPAKSLPNINSASLTQPLSVNNVSRLRSTGAGDQSYETPEKDDTKLSDISTDFTPQSNSLSSPRDGNHPKNSTPVSRGANVQNSKHFPTANQLVKSDSSLNKPSSSVSTTPAGTSGILRKAMKFGHTRDPSPGRQLDKRRSGSKEKIIDDSCSEFDEISALTMTPSKLRSRQGGVVLPWQTNANKASSQTNPTPQQAPPLPQQANPPPPASDSGVSSDTDESEPKRPTRQLPASGAATPADRSASQPAVSVLKPELSSKPKMSLPAVPTNSASAANQRRSSAPSSTHLQQISQSAAASSSHHAPSESQLTNHKPATTVRPDKSQLKLPVPPVAVNGRPDSSNAEVGDCSQAIREMRDAVRRVTAMYEQVSSHDDSESKKMANMLSSSLTDIQRNLVEMTSRTPGAASRVFLPITPTPEDEVTRADKALNTSSSLGENAQTDGQMNSAISMLEPILERYSNHLTDKVYNLIQRRLDSATPSSSSDT